MTREEVIATVGGPPGDYTGGRGLTYRAATFRRPAGEETWGAEDGVLSVVFGDDGRVAEVRMDDDPHLFPAPSPLDRLRDRLGL